MEESRTTSRKFYYAPSLTNSINNDKSPSHGSLERLEKNFDAAVTEEYTSSIMELTKLADSGLISKDEKFRRTHLITEFMNLQYGEIEEDMVTEDSTRANVFLSTLDGLSDALLSCLRDCFLGRYEVD